MSVPPKRQVVLITGATRGIGRAAALEVARRGHTVVATGRDVERLDSLRQEADAAGLAIETSRLDVSDAAACEAWTSGAVERHGRIDALVNNAGYGLWGPWEHVSDDEVRTVFETNFIGPMRLSRLAIPGMREQGFGTIIHVGSMAGQASSPAGGAYAATKFAMNTMSRSMRLEVGRFGIRVVLLEPGIFKTDFVPSQLMAQAMDRETTPYEPLRREEPLAGRPHSLAGAGARRPPHPAGHRGAPAPGALHLRLRRLPRRNHDARPSRLRHRLRHPQSHRLVAGPSCRRPLHNSRRWLENGRSRVVFPLPLWGRFERGRAPSGARAPVGRCSLPREGLRKGLPR